MMCAWLKAFFASSDFHLWRGMKRINSIIHGWRIILFICPIILYSQNSLPSPFIITFPLLIILEYLSHLYFKTREIVVIVVLLFIQISLLFAFYFNFILQHVPMEYHHHFSNYLNIQEPISSPQPLSISNPLTLNRPLELLTFPSQQFITDSLAKSSHSLLSLSLPLTPSSDRLPQINHSNFVSLFGDIPPNDFPDLKYRSPEVVRKTLAQIFHEIPSTFDPNFKNPCWIVSETETKALSENMKKNLRSRKTKSKVPQELHNLNMGEGAEEGAEMAESADHLSGLTCLPYVYILGQPKAGTSDLWARLTSHPDIHPPQRKEIRWFTRGEFTTVSRPADIIDGTTSIYDYTAKFASTLSLIKKDPMRGITIDGGPHTLWWPTQGADGVLRPDDIPTPQIIREIQPNAKFLITLANPIRRMYSDYYFLNDDRKVAKHSPKSKSSQVKERHSKPSAASALQSSEKSPQQFHERVIQQVNEFHLCIESNLDPKLIQQSINSTQHLLPSSSSQLLNSLHSFSFSNITNKLSEFLSTERFSRVSASSAAALNSKKVIHGWFRASQICAHDRSKFGVAGYGRIGIGLYILFLQKWLEHFHTSQFLILRLENYENNPKQYMTQIFEFLNVSSSVIEPSSSHGEPNEGSSSSSSLSSWKGILNEHIANQHHYDREDMFPETEKILKDFYEPYNLLLSLLLEDSDYLWEEKADPEKENSERGSARQGNGQEIYPEHEREEEHPFQSERAAHEEQFHAKLPDDELDHEPLPSRDKSPKSNLRGQKKTASTPVAVQLITPTPESFPLDNLPMPLENETMKQFVSAIIKIPLPEALPVADAFDLLCTATIGMDLVALKYLLFDYGIPSSTLKDNLPDGSYSSPFHCLSAIGMFGDANSKSAVFPLLKGKKTWLTEMFDPPLPELIQSVHSFDIKLALTKPINTTFQWLLASGAKINIADINGNTPLHIAAAYGLEPLVELYLQHGGDPNALNSQKKTPLHYAIAYGYGRMGALMVQHGGDLSLRDIHLVTPLDIISSPGVISSKDAAEYFSIMQQPVRSIQRELHPQYKLPSLSQSLYASLWKGATGAAPGAGAQGEGGGNLVGDGGYSQTRLVGYEEDMSCDVDQYWAHEITGKQVFEQYFARNRPILIRGLIDPSSWGVVEKYRLDRLAEDHGEDLVQVSPIPYSTKFGGGGFVEMKLGEYISGLRSHNLTGGRYPWYVFKGHPIRDGRSNAKNSLVYAEDVPTPRVIAEALHFVNMGPFYDTSATVSKEEYESLLASRKDFINAQWALGGAGTGAPVHYHNTAWNALIYGAKKWVLYPPSHMIMSNRQILQYFETDLLEFDQRGIHYATCVQTAGDVLVVPESWGHGVLNIEDSVAVATESKGSMWRASARLQALQHLPDDNRKKVGKAPPKKKTD